MSIIQIVKEFELNNLLNNALDECKTNKNVLKLNNTKFKQKNQKYNYILMEESQKTNLSSKLFCNLIFTKIIIKNNF